MTKSQTTMFYATFINLIFYLHLRLILHNELNLNNICELQVVSIYNDIPTYTI